MDKTYYIKWAAPAKDDLDEIIEYISKTNINYAVKVMDMIYKNVKKLDKFPKRHRIVPELEKHGYLVYRQIVVEHWRIIFKIENNFIYIMLVIDGRRNLEDILLKKMLLRENEI